MGVAITGMTGDTAPAIETDLGKIQCARSPGGWRAYIPAAYNASAGGHEVNITVNKNAIPNDPEKPFVTSGIRVGTPAATTRGFKEADMEAIASIMWRTATDFEGRQDELRAQVAQLTGKYPLYE